MFAAACVVAAPVAAVPADRKRAVRRCVVAAARARPLRRGAPAWRARPRPSGLAGPVAAAAGARGDAHDRAEEPAEASAGRQAGRSDPEPKATRSCSVDRRGGDAASRASPFERRSPRSVLDRVPDASGAVDARVTRAGKAALVSLAPCLARRARRRRRLVCAKTPSLREPPRRRRLRVPRPLLPRPRTSASSWRTRRTPAGSLRLRRPRAPRNSPRCAASRRSARSNFRNAKRARRIRRRRRRPRRPPKRRRAPCPSASRAKTTGDRRRRRAIP